MAQTTLREYLQKTEDAISAGRIDEAMARCQDFLIYFPDALEAQRLLGEVYLAQGRLAEAQQTFDWILTNDPENVIVYCDRALMSERMKDIETALDCYQQAYELSRANSQIRQEFNKLSDRTGQSDFMFSRAGLARLYMRGDLLIQAIQEWEAVLANTPGRLDARTGLLETYWREGLYDQVEQLATQILDEIPGCLKALLLLAHVTSAHNLSRAQSLVRQVEALDPEMNMAQTLFSDLMANHPNDPFLAFLKKEPILLPDVSDGSQTPVVVPPVASTIEANGSLNSVSASDPHSGWSNMESWSELDAQSVSQHGSPVVQESSAFSTWTGNTMPNVDQWATMNVTSPNRGEVEGWQETQEINGDFDPALLEQQPWHQAEQDQHSIPPEAASTWDNLDTISRPEPEAPDAWNSNIQDVELPAPPAWLDMLTRSKRTQASGNAASQLDSSSNRHEQAENTFIAHPQVEPEFNSQVTREQEDPAFFFSSEDKDEDMGWPEWLKSLGAATMDEPQPEDAAPPAPEPEHITVPDEYQDEAIDQTLSEEEKLSMVTLENLEQDLRSQGFVPLEPGMLSSIAHEQPAAQDPTLSSALDQLASFAPQTQPVEYARSPEQITSVPTVSNQQSQQAVPLRAEDVPEVVPEAPESLASETVSSQLAEKQPALQPSYPDVMPLQLPFGPTASPTSVVSNGVQEQESQPVPVSPAESTQRPVPEFVASFNASPGEETVLMPAYRADALLEDELETTMKRPAIRLQPMQQSTSRTDTTQPANRGRPGERGTGGRMPDSNLSSKERLLKGYQYQLAGSYDDAMQEYRIIIRNTPELLGEIVSNLRALLKLAPKYSAGYRVLGDAYMRQGEYLQAMEAYNKALTMAKKARSQSS